MSIRVSKCLLDMDGVLANFTDAAIKLHNLEEVAKSWPKGDYNWYTMSGMSKNAFFKSMEHDFWADLDWMPDAAAIVKLAEDKFGPERIGILTSPTANHGCPGGKREWIKRNMSTYQQRCFIGSDKSFIAGPQFLLIDDSPTNVVEFREAGGYAILVPRPWNKLHELDPIEHLTKELAKYEADR